MRDIKFRAWDKNNKEMMEVLQISFEQYPVDNETISQIVVGEVDGDYYSEYADSFELMQYTGLKDKNGREIYEGDILGLKIGGEYSPVGIVKYCDKKDTIFTGQYYLVWKNGYAHEWSYEDEGKPEYWHKLKVIGNKYDNPELLGDNNEN